MKFSPKGYKNKYKIDEWSYGCIPFRKLSDNHDNEYFLIQRITSDMSWEFPKGQPKKGESTFQAAKREFLSQTGFKISNIVKFLPKEFI